MDDEDRPISDSPLGAQSVIAAAPAVTTAVRPVPSRSPRKRLEPQFGDRIRIGVLTEEITSEIIDEVTESTGRAERRRRLLPVRAVVCFVLALCLFSSSDSAGSPGTGGPADPDREAAAPARRDHPAPAHRSGPHSSPPAAGRQALPGALRTPVRHSGGALDSRSVRLRFAAGRPGRHRAGRSGRPRERRHVRIHRLRRRQQERKPTGQTDGPDRVRHPRRHRRGLRLDHPIQRAQARPPPARLPAARHTAAGRPRFRRS
ncbi:hypothetical protein DIZ27_39840 [Streptomyces sp. NWU339]|nr:hypothetical protein DIZ27_39840 [Streptomyces sp. NWU339]